jgi:hypothetical protein
VLVGLTPAKFICAQFYGGLKGGYNQNYLHTDVSNRSFTKIQSEPGYNIGVIVKYHFKNWLSIQADPAIIQKNYSMTRTGIYTGIYQSYRNSYLQLPVTLQGSIQIKNITAFFNAGLYGAYWASGKVKGATPNILNINDSIGINGQIIESFRVISYSEKYQFDSRKDRRFEFGWLVGTGLGYTLNNKWDIFVEGRYYFSLSDQQKPYMINQLPKYNETLSVSLGILVPFDKKK